MQKSCVNFVELWHIHFAFIPVVQRNSVNVHCDDLQLCVFWSLNGSWKKFFQRMHLICLSRCTEFIKLISFCAVSCDGAKENLWTWKFCRRGCRGWQLLRDGLLQCDFLCLWHGSLFHTLCKYQQTDVNWHFGFDFSASLNSPRCQVPQSPLNWFHELPMFHFLQDCGYFCWVPACEQQFLEFLLVRMLTTETFQLFHLSSLSNPSPGVLQQYIANMKESRLSWKTFGSPW